MLLGLIGIGEMGAPIALNLLSAGYSLWVYDIREERTAEAVGAGAAAAKSISALARSTNIILTSLPSAETFVEVAEKELLPRVRPGQIFIDLGTNIPADTRRLAAEFRKRKATLLDVPVSGGPQGAAEGRLYMFAGGDRQQFEEVRPILEKLGSPDRITYCGGSGMGHVAKGVNQLAMGLGTAAFLEAIAFGVRSGLEASMAHRAVGDPESRERWRAHFEGIAGQVASGKGNLQGVKFRELPYFLREASETGFELPLTRTLYEYCDAGERVVTDDHRPAPSYWHQLTGTKGR